jgi:hypothetical protein
MSIVLMALMLAIVFGFILAYPTMLLWNLCLVPAVSVLNEVGWLQMWASAFFAVCGSNQSYHRKVDNNTLIA